MKNKSIFISIVCSLIVSLVIMNSFNSKEDFENLALGKATKSHYAKSPNGIEIHYSPKNNPENFIQNLSIYLNHPTVFYFGNSQSHSINQKKKNDKTMSGYLFDELIKDSISFLTASIPNANLQEHYLLFDYFSSKIPNIDLIIIPVFMDDLRETSIRKTYFSDFSKHNHFIYDSNYIALEINSTLGEFKKFASNSIYSTNKENKALKETTQELVENKLNNTLENKLKFWENRKTIRGNYFNLLYKTRNTIFDISSQTTRKMIRNRYYKNLNALEYILSSSNRKGIKSIVFIPPIRKDVKYPYNEYEYENFKQDLITVSKKYNATYIDLDYIIEGKYWGYTNSTQLFKEKDFDFMHFRAEAHKILADSLLPHIKKAINK